MFCRCYPCILIVAFIMLTCNINFISMKLLCCVVLYFFRFIFSILFYKRFGRSMCNGAESRGNINGEVVISKVENCHEERMRNTEGSERTCNCGTGLLQRIYHHLSTLLPTISVSEVSNLYLSIYRFVFLLCGLSKDFLMFSTLVCWV